MVGYYGKVRGTILPGLHQAKWFENIGDKGSTLKEYKTVLEALEQNN
jgi:hypothetical protein